MFYMYSFTVDSFSLIMTGDLLVENSEVIIKSQHRGNFCFDNIPMHNASIYIYVCVLRFRLI